MRKLTKYQRKIKIHQGDQVMIMSGRSRGDVGKVDEVDYKTNRVFLKDKNLIKRHQKPDMSNHEGGIVEVAAPVHISNVMVVDKNGKPSRVGYRTEDGKKIRFAKTTGETL